MTLVSIVSKSADIYNGPLPHTPAVEKMSQVEKSTKQTQRENQKEKGQGKRECVQSETAGGCVCEHKNSL